MSTAHDPTILPAGIPVPQDDGAARHLTGLKLPSLSLAATNGSQVDLSKLAGRTLVYIYPRTGVPGQQPPDGWDQIPGARGARRSHARSVIISPSSSGSVLPTCSASRHRIPATSARRSSACICRSRCSRTPSSSSPAP